MAALLAAAASQAPGEGALAFTPPLPPESVSVATESGPQSFRFGLPADGGTVRLRPGEEVRFDLGALPVAPSTLRLEVGGVSHPLDTEDPVWRVQGPSGPAALVAGYVVPPQPPGSTVGPWSYWYRTDLVVAEPRPALPAPACAPATPPEPAGGGRAAGGLPLTRAQLLVNQRIAQAAIRRLRAVQERLDAGLAARDICGHAVGAEDLAAGIGTAATHLSLARPVPATPDPIRPAAGAPNRGAVALSARQLLVNQRIAQAAVRRANALSARLEGGLTGGDIADGAIDQGKLADRLRILGSGPFVAAPPQSRTVAAPRLPAPPAAGAIRLTASQLLVNQRIAQAAVRRANALVARLEAGVTGAQIRDGSLGAADLAPAADG